MARAPRWFPAWRHLWVRALIKGGAVVLAAVIATVVKEVTGDHYLQGATMIGCVALFYGGGYLFWVYMESRQ